jgi:hypothetical protein
MDMCLSSSTNYKTRWKYGNSLSAVRICCMQARFSSQIWASHLFTLSLVRVFIPTLFSSIVSFADLCSSDHNPRCSLFRLVHKFLIHSLSLFLSARSDQPINTRNCTPLHTHFRTWYRAGTKPTLTFRNITLVAVYTLLTFHRIFMSRITR